MVICFAILSKGQAPVSFLYFSPSAVRENIGWINKLNLMNSLRFSGNSIDDFLEAGSWPPPWWRRKGRRRRNKNAAQEGLGRAGPTTQPGDSRLLGRPLEGSSVTAGLGPGSPHGWKLLHLLNLKAYVFRNYCKWKEVSFFCSLFRVLCRESR